MSEFQQRLADREANFEVMPANSLVTSADRAAQYSIFRKMVGGTPLLLIPCGNSRIWAKFEMDSPTENHYDRANLFMLYLLENEGVIKPGDTIFEGTSGSAGRSLAYFCNRLGFKLDILVPQEMDPVRKSEIEYFGANVISAQEPGGIGSVVKEYGQRQLDLINARVKRIKFTKNGSKVNTYLSDDKVVCYSNHAESLFTPKAMGDIAKETALQIPSDTRIDTYIGTLGNGSSIKGISEALREIYMDVRVIGTEDITAPVHTLVKYGEQWFLNNYGYLPQSKDQAGKVKVHDVPGTSVWGYHPPFVELDNIDEIRIPNNTAWRELQKQYNDAAWQAHHHSNYIGRTSAQNLLVAQEFGGKYPGRNILIVFFDRADQYSDYPPTSYRQPTPPFEDMFDFVRSYKSRLIPGVKLS